MKSENAYEDENDAAKDRRGGILSYGFDLIVFK